MSYDFMIGSLCGFCFFMFIEPLYVNFIYFSNVALFCDISLTKKNVDKLRKHFEYRK